MSVSTSVSYFATWRSSAPPSPVSATPPASLTSQVASSMSPTSPRRLLRLRWPLRSPQWPQRDRRNQRERPGRGRGSKSHLRGERGASPSSPAQGTGTMRRRGTDRHLGDDQRVGKCHSPGRGGSNPRAGRDWLGRVLPANAIVDACGC